MERLYCLDPSLLSLTRCIQQHPFCCSEEENQQKAPVTKHHADCRALLFLTLQLNSNPQITLMGGHGSAQQHIKQVKLMEIPHVQKHIKKTATSFFLCAFDLLYHV